ncbi:MAG: hypothetical protein B7Z59_12030 [Acidiphilium sp. 37-67-22]|nr:MAG: hypothetical protein B7Z59_12030 [Acidiphilium sp. 37-67-22]
MTPDRFAALAAAYGGAIDRWPEAERDAARAFREADPAAGRLWLAGLGLAGALASGGAIGAVLVARLVPAGGAACSQSLTVLGAPVPSCGNAANWSDTL